MAYLMFGALNIIITLLSLFDDRVTCLAPNDYILMTKSQDKHFAPTGEPIRPLLTPTYTWLTTTTTRPSTTAEHIRTGLRTRKPSGAGHIRLRLPHRITQPPIRSHLHLLCVFAG